MLATAALLVVQVAVLALPPATALEPQSTGIVQGKIGAEADRFLEGCVPFGFAGAALITIKGQAVLRKGYGLADPERATPNTTSTLFDIGSLTKQFTATAILLLEAKGKLATKDSIARHIEGVPADKQAITIHHLLTHTSGIAGTLSGIGSATKDRDEMVRKVFEAPLDAQPGVQFKYSNTGYGVLAVVIERVSGQPFETFMKENLFKPAGMKHTGFCQDKDLAREPIAIGFQDSERIGSAVEGWYSWALRGAGGVLTSIDDMQRWEDALAGRSFLAKEVRAKLYTPALETYAYGWRVRKDKRDKRVAEHGGTTRGFEAKYLRHLDEDSSIVILSNNRDLGPSISVALDHITQGEPHGNPPKTVRLDAKTLAAREGKFTISAESGLEMIVEDEGLTVYAYGQAAIDALFMQGADPEKCARIAATATKFVESLKAEDEVAATGLLKSGHFPPARTILQSWRTYTEKDGGVQSFSVLGCMVSPETGACFVRLEFASRTVTLRLGWTGDRIDGIHFGDKRPLGKRFMPESPKSFASFELISLWTRQRLLFDVSPDGKAGACSLKTDRDDVRFQRAAK